jgi:hypothetical protein
VGAALATLAVLCLAGLAPALALGGAGWPTVPLAVLAGALLAALGAFGSLVVSGTELQWFVVLALLALGASVAAVARRRGLPRPAVPPRHRLAAGLGAVGILAAAVWSLRPLRVPTVGFDARSIWLLRAGWYAGGHALSVDRTRQAYWELAHASYPPLVSAAAALDWRLSGVASDRSAVILIAVLNACALALAAWAVVEAGRFAARRLGGAPWVAAAGAVTAVLLVPAAAGVFGPFATNGYADPLWAAAALAGAAWLLLCDPAAVPLGPALVLLGVAGMTKEEGTATAVVIVLLAAARRWRAARRAAPGRPPWRLLVATGAAVVALLAWTGAMRLIGAVRDANTSGRRIGSLTSRAHATADALGPHLHVVLLALPLALVGGATLRRVRRRCGLGHDLWLWAALAGGLAAVAWAYVTGPGNVVFWLDTSADRTAIFAALVAWWIVAGWILVGVAALVPPPAGSGPDPEKAGAHDTSAGPVPLAAGSAALAVGLLAALAVPAAPAGAAPARPESPRPVHFLLLGDSVALTLGSGLAEGEARRGVSVVDDAVLGCDLDPDLEVRLSGHVGPATPGCPTWRTTWAGLVTRIRPQVVGLLVGRWEVADHRWRGRWRTVGQPAWDAHLVAELDQAVAILSSRGAKVVLFTTPFVDPPNRAPDGRPWPENRPGRTEQWNALVRRAVAGLDRRRPGVATVIDLNRLLDPGRAYRRVVDGVVARWSDGVHITPAGGHLAGTRILPVVAALGRGDGR